MEPDEGARVISLPFMNTFAKYVWQASRIESPADQKSLRLASENARKHPIYQSSQEPDMFSMALFNVSNRFTNEEAYRLKSLIPMGCFMAPVLYQDPERKRFMFTQGQHVRDHRWKPGTPMSMRKSAFMPNALERNLYQLMQGHQREMRQLHRVEPDADARGIGEGSVQPLMSLHLQYFRPQVGAEPESLRVYRIAELKPRQKNSLFIPFEMVRWEQHAAGWRRLSRAKSDSRNPVLTLGNSDEAYVHMPTGGSQRPENASDIYPLFYRSPDESTGQSGEQS